MSLEIQTFILGPAQTNAYLVADTQTNQAVVVDPAWDGGIIVKETVARSWKITGLWYTHAHFDHIGGAAEIVRLQAEDLMIAMHPGDLTLWRAGGGGKLFGLEIDPGPEPDRLLSHGDQLEVGRYGFEVRHAPGHTPGLCVFYCQEENLCFSGDLIFYRGVGRTDLPGGDWGELEKSIRRQIYTLPPETRLLSGHGPETSVGEETVSNPFIRG
ncbi:MAG: MBL fold metallo-hydrolase [Anaerolineales bacterium]|nr:MBL fold metallo-hydrolase [Anaerolineales bacterium]